MNSTYNQAQSPAKILNFAYQFPFLGDYSLALFFQKSFNTFSSFDLSQTPIKQNPHQTNWRDSYESQCKKNIILNHNQDKKIEALKIGFEEQQSTKPQKKCRQKDTRNISSNLLRIFLKNLIELKFYGRKIDLILKHLKAGFSRDQFYSWIEGFGINFKNYIRVSQVSQIVRRDQPFLLRKTFVILLHDYSRECGLLHCLTSKRIERSSLKMHLEGLKTLCKEVGSETKLQY